MEDAEAELESFRQRWRQEVSARVQSNTAGGRIPSRKQAEAKLQEQNTGLASNSRLSNNNVVDTSSEVKVTQPRNRIHAQAEGANQSANEFKNSPIIERELHSALDHYERAVEKESQGNLGDSVSLYRKAFRLDSRVHETYKAKHFPPSERPPPKYTQPDASRDPGANPNAATQSLRGLPDALTELLADFENLRVQGAPPPTDASPAPPCPIASLPEELLIEILLHTAVRDVAAFARLAQVCKRLAFLVMTEDRIWRRVALGSEFGFGAMQYRYVCDLLGRPLGQRLGGDDIRRLLDSDDDDSAPSTFSSQDHVPKPLTTAIKPPCPFPLSSTYPTYRHMFRNRPRLRFNGVYISTVNYSRPGAASPSQITWTSPVLIVTYYRYLRFFRDGTVISLLTTAEPTEVVPILHKENLPDNKHGGSGAGHGHTTGSAMKDALRGRWRLSGPLHLRRQATEGLYDKAEVPGDDNGNEEEEEEAEGDVHVETEGVVPKYMWKMQFGLGSAGRSGPRNNKLSWKGFWSYNRLTDDWGEFMLKNDRAFYWSRVKSYGFGG